jgi:hypothetical protein
VEAVGYNPRTLRQASSRNAEAAGLAGVVCGGLWALGATTVLEVFRPDMPTTPIVVAIWIATGLGVAIFLLGPGPARVAWGRAALTMGLHALGLPLAAAVAFWATSLWPPAETADLGLNVTILGVRLIATPTAVRVAVLGFVLGLLLVAIGDRALRRSARERGGRRTSH